MFRTQRTSNIPIVADGISVVRHESFDAIKIARMVGAIAGHAMGFKSCNIERPKKVLGIEANVGNASGI